MLFVMHTLTTLLVLGGAFVEDASPRQAIERQIQRLDDKDPETRLAAVRTMNRYCDEKDIVLALPSLQKLARTDPKNEVRVEALSTFARIHRTRKEPCPMLLFELLFDEDHLVTAYAGNAIGTFEVYPDDAQPHLMKFAKHKNYHVRDRAILFLGSVLKAKDPKALALYRVAQNDPHRMVRHSANSSLYRATGDIDVMVKHALKSVADAAMIARRPLPEDASEEEKVDRRQGNLIQLACTNFLWQASFEEPPQAFFTSLKKHLDVPDEFDRLRTVVAIGRVGTFGMQTGIHPLIDQPKRTEKETKELALWQNRLKGWLTQMSEKDESPAVRQAAKTTLAKIVNAEQTPPRTEPSPFERNFTLPKETLELFLPNPAFDPKAIEGISNTIWFDESKKSNSIWIGEGWDKKNTKRIGESIPKKK